LVFYNIFEMIAWKSRKEGRKLKMKGKFKELRKIR
jgi:hypothetical protein